MEVRTLTSCTTKRKAAGDEMMPTIKRKHTASLGCSPSSAAAAVAKHEEEEEEAPVKTTRLPQEEVDYVLGRVMDDDRLPRDYKALKRHNPDLIPSPEEETDEELVGLYAGARLFYAIGERFSSFQAWVRRQYEKRGYVEVDDELLASSAQNRAWNDEAREEALKDFDFSDMDDDMIM